MNTKLQEKVNCPYCGNTEFHIFHYGADTLFCSECNKEFAIELKTIIVVKSAKIYNKQCCACDTYLHDEEIKNDKCPKCSCDVLKDNNYKYSEFNINK